MDEPDINTINTKYIDIIGQKINIITESVDGLIANYTKKLNEIKKLQPNGSDESDGNDGNDGNDGSDETQDCSTVQAEFNEYKTSVNKKIADLLAEMKNDASKLEKLNTAVTTAVTTAVGSGNPFAGGRKHKRSKKRSKHNKRRTTHKKQSRRRRRH